LDLILLMASAINTSDTLFGIAALYMIEKSRSGDSSALGQLIKGISLLNTCFISLRMYTREKQCQHFNEMCPSIYRPQLLLNL
jgi:hypothetical protein